MPTRRLGILRLESEFMVLTFPHQAIWLEPRTIELQALTLPTHIFFEKTICIARVDVENVEPAQLQRMCAVELLSVSCKPDFLITTVSVPVVLTVIAASRRRRVAGL